jgi:hypothetical protein
MTSTTPILSWPMKASEARRGLPLSKRRGAWPAVRSGDLLRGGQGRSARELSRPARFMHWLVRWLGRDLV